MNIENLVKLRKDILIIELKDIKDLLKGRLPKNTF